MRNTSRDLPWSLAALAVFLGGGIGSVLRWMGSIYAENLSDSSGCMGICRTIVGGGGVNIDTWILNLISVFVLAFITARLVSNPNRRRSQTLKLALGTGFCGGLGTYGGPVWQIISFGKFHLGYLAELLAMFALALPVGLFALWLGSRHAFTEVNPYRDSPADFTLPSANDPTTLPPYPEESSR